MAISSDNTEEPLRTEAVQKSEETQDCSRGQKKDIQKMFKNRSRRSILLAQASHEIKTPLASILGFTESLLNHGHLTDEDKKDVIAIKRQSQYMNDLVRDLIDIARLDGHQFPFQIRDVNPVQLLDDVIQATQVRYHNRKLDLHIEYPPALPLRIKIDPTRFHQALSQVLSNAYNYTFEGQIDIKIDFDQDPNTKQGQLTIQVQDSGIGMSQTTQKRIFNAFMRGDYPEVQKTPGTGLGLTLARSLIRAMDGHLYLLDSSLGLGSVFEIGLKLPPITSPFYSIDELRKEQPGAETPVKPSELKGRKILVVDDSVDLRVLMRRYLNKAGACVETSENGAEAVSKALRNNFDCILMDIRMPVMNGYEATQLLRESGYDRPIIAVSAQPCDQDQECSADLGFTAFLSKPVNFSQLKDMIRTY